MSLLCPDHTDEAVAIGELGFLQTDVVWNSVSSKSTTAGLELKVPDFVAYWLVWHVDSEPGGILCRL